MGKPYPDELLSLRTHVHGRSRSSIRFFVFFLHTRLGKSSGGLLGVSGGLLILRFSPAILPFLEEPRIRLPGVRAALMICRSIANLTCTHACTCKSVLHVFFFSQADDDFCE